MCLVAAGVEVIGAVVEAGLEIYSAIRSIQFATEAIDGFSNALQASSDAPGRTAGGKPTDVHGNPIGPSGKIQVNENDHSTFKGAKDAARGEGKGKPVKHPSPAKGKPHFHPTGPDGEKIPGGTHHTYPE